MKEIDSIAGKIAFSLGKGILAGLAGTAAITVSQMIEMKINDREPSAAPAEAASKVLDVEAVNEEKKMKFAQEVHWSYGTSWGLGRSMLGLAGVKGLPATLAHFASIWGTAMTMQPALDVAPPLKDWKAKTIATGGVHHLVYAVVSGLVYDNIS